jgi:hypothetical protein
MVTNTRQHSNGLWRHRDYPGQGQSSEQVPHIRQLSTVVAGLCEVARSYARGEGVRPSSRARACMRTAASAAALKSGFSTARPLRSFTSSPVRSMPRCAWSWRSAHRTMASTVSWFARCHSFMCASYSASRSQMARWELGRSSGGTGPAEEATGSSSLIRVLSTLLSRLTEVGRDGRPLGLGIGRRVDKRLRAPGTATCGLIAARPAHSG